jgi:hypothetical protein
MSRTLRVTASVALALSLGACMGACWVEAAPPWLLT